MLSANFKRKLNNLDKVMNIEKPTEFCLLKEKIEEVVKQSKRLDSKSRRLNHLIKFLKDS